MKTQTNKITLAFLTIDYLYKVLCSDNNFYHFLSSTNLKYFNTTKDAETFGNSLDIKNLKIVSIDEFNNVKTLKYIN